MEDGSYQRRAASQNKAGRKFLTDRAACTDAASFHDAIYQVVGVLAEEIELLKNRIQSLENGE